MLCATPAERKTDPAQLRLTNQDEGEEGLGKEIKVLYVEKIRSNNERDYEGKALYTVCVLCEGEEIRAGIDRLLQQLRSVCFNWFI